MQERQIRQKFAQTQDEWEQHYYYYYYYYFIIVVVIIIMDYACHLATSTNVIRRLKEHIITK